MSSKIPTTKAQNRLRVRDTKVTRAGVQKPKASKSIQTTKKVEEKEAERRKSTTAGFLRKTPCLSEHRRVKGRNQ